MKRSEMVNKVAFLVAQSKGNLPVSSNDLFIASVILKELEKEGMKPPGYMKPIPFESDGNQYPLIPGDFKNDKGIWCTPGVQEWESEDDSSN